MIGEVGPEGIALIQHFEGCTLHTIADPGSGAEPWTIGWGHTGPGIHPGLVWTQAQCDAQLEQDVELVARQVEHAIAGRPTTLSQFGAMVSFSYNVGIGNFLKSSVLRYHRAGAYSMAAASFKAWDKSAGHVMPGLLARRETEAKFYSTGAWR